MSDWYCPLKKTSVQHDALGIIKERQHTLLFGGSRSGKTFILIFALVRRALQERSRHCVLRKHFTDVNKAIICDTFPSVMEKCFPPDIYTFNRALNFAYFPSTGSEIWFGGLDNGDKILGNEYVTMYFNECSELAYNQIETAYSRNAQRCQTLQNKFFYDENPVGKSHWSYKLFVAGLNPIDNKPLTTPDIYGSMKMNPVDNQANLSETYMQTLANLSYQKRQRFEFGEWQDDSANALWKRDTMISPYRTTGCPDLDRIIVAIDPAVTSAENSDETGIVVAGRAKNPKTGDVEYYVLDDRTMKGTPNEWARQSIDLYMDYDADRIVAEVNNGGDLVENIIHNIDAGVSYMAVRATRGKILRAEPISALYERGLVHHVGEFQQMEDEMCNYTGGVNEDSPNRLDALVWALTELSGGACAEPESGEIALSY